jgi:RNA polymerase sigma-70 factor (ECF subfamily)
LLSQSVHIEKILFEKIAKGDEGAFREIFEQYGPVLYPFVFGIVKNEAMARDIIQEVFLRIWLKKGGLSEIENPSSWIYRIASNLALTHFRRQRLETKVLQSIQGQYRDEGDPDPVTESFSLKELQELIGKAAALLPSQRQKIFKMSRDQGLSRQEIAGQLNISENTVKNQLRLSLKFIQEFIGKTNGCYIPFLLLLPAMQPH